MMYWFVTHQIYVAQLPSSTVDAVFFYFYNYREVIIHPQFTSDLASNTLHKFAMYICFSSHGYNQN